MRRLGDDIQHFARRHGLRQGIETAAVIRTARVVLPTVLPQVLHESVRVESFREGALTISAPTGSSVATVQQYRQPLLQALKIKIGRAIVERLIVRARLSDD